MKKSFVELFKHHESLIGKQVGVLLNGHIHLGFLKSVDQVVYGIKPSYNLILADGSLVKLSGILVPDYIKLNDKRLSNFIFEPY